MYLMCIPKADLESSFGSTVGAPVLFFLGGFVYTVLDADNTLGDNDTAHALAFGLCKWRLFPVFLIGYLD